MEIFITYIEDILHTEVNAAPYAKPNDLPLYLRNVYELYTALICDVQFLLAKPVEHSNLTALRKQCGQLKKLTGLECVLCLDNARIYTKEKMLSEGIPFVITGQQIYMPFLGIALNQIGVRETPYTEQLSFTTQKLLLTAIYQGWKQTTLTEAAKWLNVSKMTVTRCFDEIQSIGLQLIESDRKMRCFRWGTARLALWDTVRPFLRNPVIRQYRYGERFNISDAKLGGISAVSQYSMLADNPYITYAVTRTNTKMLDLVNHMPIPDGEAPDMIVQITPYDIVYGDNTAIDPLTAILSLTNDELQDPRVEGAVEEILEACLND